MVGARRRPRWLVGLSAECPAGAAGSSSPKPAGAAADRASRPQAATAPPKDAAPDRGSPLIQFEDVSVSFGRLVVLRSLNLTVRRGESVAVIGESGCGKTVLLKLIIGLLRPTAGRVLFDGRSLAELNDKELTKERMRFGFLFQGSALFDSLTVFENVAFPLRQHTDRDEETIQATVGERLQEVGLAPSVERKMPAELSGGMRKRVGLARALAMNPEVLLYDEPTTGLDPIMSDVINGLIVETRKRHSVTSVIVTHDMRTALGTADRVVMLYPLARLARNESQVLFDGRPAEIEKAADPRVLQFVRGEAQERMSELAREREGRR